MRHLVLLACLLATPAFAAPLLVAEASPAEKLEQKRAELEKLREERDAARVKANIYVLPQHKLEALAKQEAMDAVEQEIEALEREAAGG